MCPGSAPHLPIDLPAILDLQRWKGHRFQQPVIFAGAGLSAESGIATFRSGMDGLWRQYSPTKLATPQAWACDSALVWAWYEWRRSRVIKALPHPGHIALVQFQEQLGATLITQNVDNLLERAGAKNVIHLHGSLFTPRCGQCEKPFDETTLPILAAPCSHLAPPLCPSCTGEVRPGVVWFGEGLDQSLYHQACKSIAACDVLIVVGTSGVVHPAAGMVQLASNATLKIEINPDTSKPSLAGWQRLPLTAAQSLPILLSWFLVQANSRQATNQPM